MTHLVGPKGQVVIPKSIRERLGIKPGDRVEFSREDDRVVLWRINPAKPLRGRFRGTGLVEELERQRLADSNREDNR
ncbi:MAG: AbrB/MazE/SpoVT family DNA-binding domain-containing protein [Microthrixaceae bacterium]|nr:AbrB/MazE/SpoVT family DNA-binding domain-containing protein [Microthrixaceae bacterium]